MSSSSRPVVLPYGPTAVMVEVADTPQAIDMARWLRDRRDAGAIHADDIVPGARTVLVRVTSGHHLPAVVAEVETYRPGAHDAVHDRLVEIEVRYDGADLVEVAGATGCSIGELVRRHSEREYTAAFGGFAPGFVYLTGLDPALQLPRRSTPRPSVPAGSVAIASEFTGVYPTSSPGGWHLLGTTEAVLWDPARPLPSLITPGDRVRFVAVSRGA